MSIVSQITNRGKTVISNIDDVSKDINFPPDWIIAYFGSILNCQYNYSKISILSTQCSTETLNEYLNNLKELIGVCDKCKDNNSQYLTTKKSLAVICNCCNRPRNVLGLNEKFCLTIWSKEKQNMTKENYLSLIL